MRKEGMLKIFDGEKTYVPIAEIERTGVKATFPDYLVKDFGIYGKAVSEDDYNAFLSVDRKAFEANGGTFELTRATSVRCRLADLEALAPLKLMFLTSMGESRDAAARRLSEEADKDSRETVRKICGENPDRTEAYRRETAFVRNNSEYFRSVLEPLGLELQLATETSEKGIPGLICFIAGENVFRMLYLNEWEKEDFERFERLDDGTIVVPEPQEYEDARVVPADVGRDFRGKTALENMFWCFRHVPMSNDACDWLTFSLGGIYFSVSTPLLAKALNPKSFPQILLFDGTADVEESAAAPKDPNSADGKKESD